MILSAAEKWGCTPHEAATRLLDRVANKELADADEVSPALATAGVYSAEY